MDKLNFVWFCTDQQRYDTISRLGNKFIHTPNIDKLVDEGFTFTQAYTQCPVCTPSRASFLTGRYPRTTKACFNGNDTFSADEILVTKLLADNDYTCGLTGKLHLTGAFGRIENRIDDGYSFFKWSHHPHDDWEEGVNQYQQFLKANSIDWKNKTIDKKPSEFYNMVDGIQPEFHQTTWCVDEAINFIESCDDNPFLISINPFDPHPPLDPPQQYKDKLNIEDMPLPLWQDGELDNKPALQKNDYFNGGQNGIAKSITKMTNNEKRENTRDYYAMIELIDDQLGKLLNYLEDNGLKKNTVIIFMSDHGEMNGDHGLYKKGAYFYQALVHVPLIISCPGVIQSDVKSCALVELVDIAPTILELAGHEIPYYIQGKSLASMLKGEKSPDYHKDAVYCEYYNCLLGGHDVDATMYYDGRYKLVVYHGMDIGELYDLKSDPNEYSNLWNNDKYTDILNSLIKKSFDNAIMCNKDLKLNRKYLY